MRKNTIQIVAFSGALILGLLAGNYKSFGQTYCTPSYGASSYGGCLDQDEINDVELTGENGTSISNPNSGCSGGILGYGDYTSLTPVQLIQGSTYSISVSTDYPLPQYENVRAWIDYDNDGTFQNSEEIFSALTVTSGISTTGTSTFSFTIPANTSTGLRRMRIRLGYYSSTIDPCSNITYGETEDYTVQVIPLAPPNNAGVVSLVNPDSSGAFCSGTQEVKVRVSNLGKNPMNSVRVDWSVNGVQQTGQALTFSPAVDSISAPKHDTVISLGYVDFPYQTAVNIKAWTSLPNGVTDTDPTDDTLNLDVTSNMQGVTTHISPQDTAICEGSSVILDAGAQPAGVIFIWNNGAITQQTAVSQTGAYNVIVQSSEGCFAYDTVMVTVNPQPIAGAFGVVDIGGGNFQFTPSGMQNVTNYHWDFGDGTTLDAGYPNMQGHHYTQSGTYAVSLTVSNSCGAITLNKQVFVQPTTGIKDAGALAGALKVYPNPANNLVNIKAEAANVQLQQVSVYNMIGKKVYTKTLQGATAEISVASLPAGVYQLIIRTNKGAANSKLEIMR